MSTVLRVPESLEGAVLLLIYVFGGYTVTQDSSMYRVNVLAVAKNIDIRELEAELQGTSANTGPTRDGVRPQLPNPPFGCLSSLST